MASEYDVLLEEAPVAAPSASPYDALLDPPSEYDALLDVPPTEPAGGATTQSETASGSAVPVIEAPSAVPAEPAPPLELGTRFVKGMAQSTAQAASGAARLAKLAKPLMPVGGQLIPSGAWDDIADFSKDVQDSAAEVYKTDPRGDERLISKVAQGAGSIVPIIASGPLAIATGGAMAGESARQEAEAAGATQGQQEATLALNAVTGAITEKLLGVPALLKSAKAAGLTGPDVVAGIRSAVEKVAGKVGYQTLASGLREGGQEFLQQLASNAIAKGIYEPARDIFQGGLENFLVGTLVGGPLGAGVQVAQNIDTRRATQVPAAADDMAAAAAPVAEPSIDVIPPDFEPIAAEAEAAGATLSADALRQTISETPQPEIANAPEIQSPDETVPVEEQPVVSPTEGQVAEGTAQREDQRAETGAQPETVEAAGVAPASAMIRPSAQALAFTPKNPVISWITGNAKRLFTAQGDLPKPVFQKWVERTGRVAQEAKATQFAVKDLYDSVAEEFKISTPKMLSEGLASVPEAFVDQMNTALSGDAAAMAALPPKVQSAVSAMRTHIDTLSEEMVRKGLVDSDLAAAISANQGTYLTRTYKIFEDKKWAEKIPTQIFNRARTFLHRELTAKNPAATVDDADRVLRNMLSDWASEGRDLRAKGGTLGSKDLTSFIKRKNIAPELRDVMGENRNIIHNYATSVSKTARFIADQEFLNHVRQIGTGQFLFTSDNAPEGFNTQIAAEGSQVLAPLNGMRTSPEIARAFAEWGKAGATDPGPILRALRVVNAWGKGVKTVGSLLTQARNMTGQPIFFLANGHFDMKPLKDAAAAVAGDTGLRSDAAARAIVLDAANHGLVGENAYAGEFREAWQEAMLNSSSDVPNEFISEFIGKRLIRKTVKGAERLYQTTDELGKIVGWMNERQRLTEMYPGTPDAEIKRIAAERVRNCYPTYSMSPQALRTFRKQPFFGPFVTFWYETFRTTFHNLRYAIEDLKGPTEAHKKAGAQRLGGTMAVLSLAGFGVQMATKAMFGIDDKEEEDVRRMLPPWAQNAQLAFTGKEDKTYDFINLSYMNPYSTISDPIIGMISGFQRGDNADEMFGRGLAEVFRPFLAEQIATGALIDVLRNQTKTGKRVFNPQDSWEVKAPAMTTHILGAAFVPGTIDRLFRRIIPAMKGEVSPYGRAPEPGKEIAAEFTGVRFESLDMKQALQFKTGRFINDENDAEQIFRSVASRRGAVAEKDIVDAYRSAEESRFELWQDLYRDYRAARRSGVSESEARQAMSARRLPKATILDITAGRYRPYTPSDELIRKAREYGHPLPIPALREVRAKIPSVLQDVKSITLPRAVQQEPGTQQAGSQQSQPQATPPAIRQ